MTDNPLLETWTAPFGLPPFDRIRPEHFAPALDRAMAEEAAEIAAIAHSAEAPGFANTIEALERSGRLLDRVTRVFSNLEASAGNDALDAVAREYMPKLAEHRTKIALDPDLFARVAALYGERHALGLAPDQLRLLERYHLRFVRAGALLGPAAKARIAAINERLAELHTRFSQNVVHDEKDWHLPLDAGGLEGLPDFVREAAAAVARERGLAGHAVTLSRSAVEPFLSFSPRRDLRRRLYEAWTSRGAHPGDNDNRALIGEILALRAEQARLLGYADFADYRLDDSMAKTVAAARGLLEKVWEPAKHRAGEERAKLATAASADGLNDKLAPWDWHYYAERVRKAEFDVDEAEAKPYFALDNVVQAAFAAAGRLFGLAFVERHDLPVYHPDVRVWEARGRDGGALGLFLHDNFARPGKRSGAWMASYRVQQELDGPVLPIIVNNNNFARGEPTLLSFDDVRTLFHEFGHGLHGLLSRVRYPSQSGTAVRRDFVEFPSQIFEHWATAPELLREYAVHYRTGQPLPEELLRRLIAARDFNQGFATVEYAAAALIDLELHAGPAPAAGFDPIDYERRFAERIGVPEEIGIRHRLPHFQHLFAGGGYAAGYYAYLWAEVLDADGFAAFAERGDFFDPDLAARLERIYRAGDSEDPMALYRAFRGRDPEVAALLRQRGLMPG